jgi:hypothetical protein
VKKIQLADGLSATSQQYFSLTTNQPTATSQQYFSQNKPAPAISHQPNEQAKGDELFVSMEKEGWWMEFKWGTY